MIIPIDNKPVVSHNTRYCQRCGNPIVKQKNRSWTEYSKRKFCGDECFKGARMTRDGCGVINGMNPDSKDEMPIMHYIGKNSRNGRLMADYNLGILKAVEKVGDAQELSIQDGKINTVICMYKGIPVSPEMAKGANQWLMDNWIGKASQRLLEPEKDDRTEEQKMEELKYTMKELGYEMVKIGEKVGIE